VYIKKMHVVYRPGIFYVNVPIIAFFRHCGEFFRREKITRELTSVYKKKCMLFIGLPLLADCLFWKTFEDTFLLYLIEDASFTD
jgi:hypothetical protein